MTQEELDALMAGDMNAELNEKVEESHHHDMAEQLGSVTKESEVKATEIFDKLESILELTNSLKTPSQNLEEGLVNIENIVMDIMSTMQYQDIHRQKIERVINNMRSISKLMNQTLHIVDDEEIAPSAKHIAGDDTSDLVSDEELEALIASMK
jgi:prophage DNA circulation protein